MTSEQAPVHEVVQLGDDIDATALPLLIHQEFDAGKYITSAAAITRDPGLRPLNAGIFRHQLQGPRQVGLHVQPGPPHLLHPASTTRSPRAARGGARASAITPACSWAPVSKLAGIGGELEVMGGLMDEPLEVVKAKTVDLDGPGARRDHHRGRRRHGPGEGPERRPVRRVPALLHAHRPHAVAAHHCHHHAQGSDLRGRLQRPRRAPRPRRAAADGLDHAPRAGVDAHRHGGQPARSWASAPRCSCR